MRKRKRLVKNLFILFSIAALSLISVYVGLAVYYHNAFEYGTWINGVYCTGRSVEDVNEELAAAFSYEGVTVYDKDGNAYVVMAKEIDYQFDFAAALRIYLKQQNSWAWIDSLVHGTEASLSPVVSYDSRKLEECLADIPALNAEAKTEQRLEIVRTDEGYELINERIAVLNREEAVTAIREAVDNSLDTVFLEEAGCYHDLPLTAEMQDTLQLWDKIEALQDCGIVYQMGEERIPVDAAVVSGWIQVDENGRFLLDEMGNPQIREDAIEEFVKNLASEYDTVGGSREFHATKGDVVTVEGGIYGNKIDQQTEIAYLTEAFYQKKTEVHEPEYSQKALAQGKDDIGGTYIEVDMGNQMMYYYVDGALQIETPIVTGNTSRRMGTPSGTNYVYQKQTNRVLRGPGYASHVDFWMPVKGNIGIHDASWRSKYGGTIYQTNGSHGCINTPRAIMEELYAKVEVGTPVVMFY